VLSPEFRTDAAAWPPPDEFAEDVATDPALRRTILPAAPQVVTQLVSDLTEDDGTMLPPDEVAARLADALREVESQDDDGSSDPLGWLVAVDLEVHGLDDAQLLLTWSLDGIDVPVSWAAETIAYRITPTTAHDTGSVDVWVPDLDVPGTYRVNLRLALESDGRLLDQGDPLELPE
jgi:hypothetical protein